MRSGSAKTGHKRKRGRENRYRRSFAQFEALEDRWLMASSASINPLPVAFREVAPDYGAYSTAMVAPAFLSGVPVKATTQDEAHVPLNTPAGKSPYAAGRLPLELFVLERSDPRAGTEPRLQEAVIVVGPMVNRDGDQPSNPAARNVTPFFGNQSSSTAANQQPPKPANTSRNVTPSFGNQGRRTTGFNRPFGVPSDLPAAGQADATPSATSRFNKALGDIFTVAAGFEYSVETFQRGRLMEGTIWSDINRHIEESGMPHADKMFWEYGVWFVFTGNGMGQIGTEFVTAVASGDEGAVLGVVRDILDGARNIPGAGNIATGVGYLLDGAYGPEDDQQNQDNGSGNRGSVIAQGFTWVQDRLSGGSSSAGNGTHGSGGDNASNDRGQDSGGDSSQGSGWGGSSINETGSGVRGSGAGRSRGGDGDGGGEGGGNGGSGGSGGGGGSSPGATGDVDDGDFTATHYDSLEDYQRGASGTPVELPADDPMTGHGGSGSAGNDIGGRNIPGGGSQTPLGSDLVIRPIVVLVGTSTVSPDDSGEPQMGSSAITSDAPRGSIDANADDVGGNSVQRGSGGGSTLGIASPAAQLWWAINGPRAQPPK
jgi:hypothetical protein